ncbi:MAG: cell wall hydrolase [Lachnospiraceae bacterium]|nr:cell wall hydrolase [Lachnospiraceae bacterium]
MKNQQKSNWKKFLLCSLAGVLFLLSPMDTPASKTSGELKKTGEKIDELKEQKEAAEDKVDALKEQQSHLQGELADLNQQLCNVTEEINSLEVQIGDKETEIAVTQEELAAAIDTKEKQYESMKKRIQYIYETGGIDLASIILESKSMGEMLNKAEYVEAINKYDREMLHRYEDTCEQVALKEETLKQEKTELVGMQESMESKKTEVDSLISKTKDSISAKENEISDAKDVVSDYDAQIAKMKAYEEELERKKAEEAKKQAEQQKKKPAPTSGGGTVTANSSDAAMLAAIVECEAVGESYEGQLAVASVVVNRVKSSSFPNTISGVIYQGGQFSPVASGRFAVVLARGASGSCVQAANAALSGNTNISALYFCRASSGISGTVIGNHVFY